MVFEDIIGGVEKKEDDVAHVIVGNGVDTCPLCGSDDITKGYPIYLLNNHTNQHCECKDCKATWSLSYDPNNKKYVYEVHNK